MQVFEKENEKYQEIFTNEMHEKLKAIVEQIEKNEIAKIFKMPDRM